MKKVLIFVFFISLSVSPSAFGQETADPVSEESQKDGKSSGRKKRKKKQESIPSVPQDSIVSDNSRVKDSLPPAQKYGLRFGVDLARLIRTSVDDEYTGFEVVGDYRIYRDFYIAGELGNETLEKITLPLETRTSGNYLKLGGDYNVYDNWYGMQNLITVGLRYGISNYSQELNRFRIATLDPVFGEDFRQSDLKVENLTSSWLEFIAGIKAELFQSNLYLGFSISLKRMLSEQSPDNFDNVFIPGFGKTNDFSRLGVGYNYTLTYLLPLYKKKK